jgi:ribulose 1,5-bisphosphate carboxylase large subunit-like protein
LERHEKMLSNYFWRIKSDFAKTIYRCNGKFDFITTMGAGCHAHPKGTQAGAKALVQACEAYIKKIDIKEYAKNHKELAEAIEFFTKDKRVIRELES